MTTTTQDTNAAVTAAAANELFQAICHALTAGRGVHLETAIAAGGYLAGAALIRCADVDLSGFQPGSHVIVDEVNETGPLLIETLFDLCDRSGIDPEAPMPDDVPAANRPLREYADLMATCGPVFDRVCASYDVPPDLCPFVAVRAVAQFIVAGREQLDGGVAKALAMLAIVRGAKTVPPRAAAARGDD